MSRRTTRNLLLTVVTVCLGLTSLEAQVQMTIGNVTGKHGDTLEIPISTTSIALTDSVYSFQATFSVNAGVLKLIGVDTTGTFLAGFGTPYFNPTTNTVAISGVSRLAGSGNFLYLKGVLVGNPGTQTVVSTVAPTQLNEGKPSLNIVNGSARVLQIQISPHTPGTIYAGDVVQFAASGDTLRPFVWSSSDTTVGKIDATGKFHAITAGQAKVLLSDGHGLKDSTSLFGVYSVLAKDLTLSVHDTSYTQTLQFKLPIYVSDVSGLGAISSQFTLTYNSSLLQAISVDQTNSMTSSWGAPTFNVSSGRVDIALAGTSALSGSGVLVYVRFKVPAAASGSTVINISSVLFNENLNASTVSGTFSALTAPTLVISPSTAILSINDAVQFQVTSGGHPPYQWATAVPSVASIDSMGVLRGLSRGTTSVTATDSLGFVGTSGTVTVNDFRIGIPDTAMGLGDSVEVPITTGDLTGLGVFAYQSRITYDSTIVRVAAVLGTGTLSSGLQIAYRDTLDTLRISAAGSLALVGSGTLLKVRFKSAASGTGVTSPIHIVTFSFNEGIPTATAQSGSISIIGPPTPPSLISPADNSIGVSNSPTLTWAASAGANSYRLQVSTDNNFSSTLVDSSGIVTTSLAFSGLTPGTSCYWRVAAKNVAGYSSYSTVRQFTTEFVPASPLLVSPLQYAVGVTRSPILVWKRSLGALTYRLQFSTDSTFASTMLDSAGVVDSSVAFTNLLAYTKYYWRVNATNTYGTSSFSPFRAFTTGNASVPPSVPVLLSPADHAIGLTRSPQLVWSTAVFALTYRLQLSTDSMFVTTLLDSSGIVDTSTTITNLGSYTKYFWRVDASNTLGTSAFSSVYSFTTGNASTIPSAPVLLQPADSSSGVTRSPRLVWGQSAVALTYRLQLSKDSTFATTAYDSSGIVDTAVSFSNLDAFAKYFWRANASNTLGTSAFSHRVSFITGNASAIPAIPVLLTPVDKAAGIARNPRLVWAKATDALTYRVQLSTDSTFASTVRDTTDVADTVLTNSGLLANTKYFWRVYAANSLGTSAFSSSRTFTTGTSTGVEDDLSGVPKVYVLEQNFPNPFNPSTIIRYGLRSRSSVRLQVYNILGQLVYELVNREEQEGYHSVTWNPSVSSGVYFYRLEARSVVNSSDRFIQIRKMILMK